jgi:hypothetical protein
MRERVFLLGQGAFAGGISVADIIQYFVVYCSCPPPSRDVINRDNG